MQVSKEDFRALVELERRLAELSVRAEEIADGSDLSRRAIAERMGHASPSTVQRLLKGAAYRATVETLARFAWACGQELHIEFRPRGEVRPGGEVRTPDDGEMTRRGDGRSGEHPLAAEADGDRQP